MKKLSNQKLLLLKKVVGAACALLCLLFMLFNVFNYTSSTSLASGENLTWSEGFSMINFLFNGKKDVLETTISILREVFSFSFVIVWVSFVLQIVALGILIYGIFNRKSLFSKIGSITLVVSLALLILVSFETYSLGKTVRYLSIFTPFYFISLAISIVGLIGIFNIKNR